MHGNALNSKLTPCKDVAKMGKLYIRVSSIDQKTDRQLEGMKLDKVFTDKASGRDRERPELKNLLDWIGLGKATP